MTTRRAMFLTLGVLLGASSALAAGKPRRAQFAPHERTAILGYFQAYPSDLPPGLAKRGSLPPGLQKHLAERGGLPPGLQKRIAPFPLALEQRLGPPPEGLRRGCLGDRAVLYDPATYAVIDSFVVSIRIQR